LQKLTTQYKKVSKAIEKEQPLYETIAQLTERKHFSDPFVRNFSKTLDQYKEITLQELRKEFYAARQALEKQDTADIITNNRLWYTPTKASSSRSDFFRPSPSPQWNKDKDLTQVTRKHNDTTLSFFSTVLKKVATVFFASPCIRSKFNP